MCWNRVSLPQLLAETLLVEGAPDFQVWNYDRWKVICSAWEVQLYSAWNKAPLPCLPMCWNRVSLPQLLAETLLVEGAPDFQVWNYDRGR
ncbi:hypothetical protein GDO81_029479 [Engystomops pustulosus]|uniref:Uncharacterized protein n=1 Tax=Engystomops pustulosus TaxID=76066 RepID=A0AAV6ZL59_ENGPU|nr:hypothetical protein GDO81_029479 [Engystomops pustulosus]